MTTKLQNKNQSNSSEEGEEEKTLSILRQEVKEGMGEVENVIPIRLMEFKKLLKKDKELVPHPPSFDEFYVRCLRAKKYNLEGAANLYRKFCRLKTGVAEDFLNKLIPSWYKDLINSMFCSSLKTRDDLGRTVAIIRMDQWNHREVPLDDILLTIFLYMDELTTSEDTQLFGITCIADLTSLGIEHVRLISPYKIYTLIKVAQDSYPLRSKELHFVNNPKIFGTIFSIAKPFIKDKMKKRIHFHGDNMASLHSALKLDCTMLPEFLGGQISNEEYKDESVPKRILKKDPYYEELLKYGYVKKS